MTVEFAVERWAYRSPFVSSQWAIEALDVVVVTIEADGATGRGECCPALHIGESLEQTIARLEDFVGGCFPLDRATLQEVMPACPARNALDCALWDLSQKRAGVPPPLTRGLPGELTSVYTISLGAPEAMGEAARQAGPLPQLKLKLGDADQDEARVRAVRSAAPHARLVADVNGAWCFEALRELAPRLRRLGVELIEQPMPREADHVLAGWRSPIPLCADESVTDLASLDRLSSGYRFINIKLDKTGGLTEALDLLAAAKRKGLGVFVGNMGGTSLAMAPAFQVAACADYVDLDGPLLLAADRSPTMVRPGARLATPDRRLWG
jgi:L-alanine-DL-glutamate epimerase-like enolase superfamily enzyme